MLGSYDMRLHPDEVSMEPSTAPRPTIRSTVFELFFLEIIDYPPVPDNPNAASGNFIHSVHLTHDAAAMAAFRFPVAMMRDNFGEGQVTWELDGLGGIRSTWRSVTNDGMIVKINVLKVQVDGRGFRPLVWQRRLA